MRHAGTLPGEQEARLFSDYLSARGIDNEVEPSQGGGWALWIHNDAQMEEGRAELERFLQDPTAPVYRELAPQGRERLSRKEKEDAEFRERMVDVRTTWSVGFGQHGIGWLTAILIGLSVIITGAAMFGSERAIYGLFMIANPYHPTAFAGWPLGLQQLREGQIWRVLTPIFIHFGPLHIIFNMLWLKQLGSSIEFKEGTFFLFLQVLLFGVLSNAGQYFVTQYPLFGGMSGVVYGLFGYVWIRGKYDPKRPYHLEQNTVILMMVWFVVCFTGFIGSVANTAHAIGLAAGVIWATISVRRIPFTSIRW